MGGSRQFRARVEPHGKTATFFHVPSEVVAALGPKKRVAVRVTVNGHSYRSTVAPMGGEFLLPLNRTNRESAGLKAGDEVEVELETDDEPRLVELPGALRAALDDDPTADEAFARLSYSHQREYAEWINEAKREETRVRRVVQAIERLRQGRTAR